MLKKSLCSPISDWATDRIYHNTVPPPHRVVCGFRVLSTPRPPSALTEIVLTGSDTSHLQGSPGQQKVGVWRAASPNDRWYQGMERCSARHSNNPVIRSQRKSLQQKNYRVKTAAKQIPAEKGANPAARVL